MSDFGIYVHIPYCLHKCPYCDFNTYAATKLPQREYTAALLAELDYYASLPEWSKRPVKTVFFGGGTPSLFDPFYLDRIITLISKLFPTRDDLEISIEVNPGTIDLSKAKSLLSIGINRLSIGVQSFLDQNLKTLGRLHTAQQSVRAFEIAREAGFKNVSLDLMFGLPKQKLGDLKKDIKQVLKLEPEHISTYGLTVEKGTEFYNKFNKGQLKLPSEKLVLSMMGLIRESFSSHDYVHYEISNFAKPTFKARHNLAYWDSEDYLGLGAGAHSYVLGDVGWTKAKRWANFADPKAYMEAAVSSGMASSWMEELSKRDLVFEFFFLGLRKIKGVSLREFEGRFGVPIRELYGDVLDVLLGRELVELTDENLRLSESGFYLADSVVQNFAWPAEAQLKESLPEVIYEPESKLVANS